MALAIGRIEDQSFPIVQRLAQLLHARVWVTDVGRRVVASTEPADVGHDLATLSARSASRPRRIVTVTAPDSLRRLNAAEITLEQLDGERIPPHLAQAIVDLGVKEIAYQTMSPSAHELKNYFLYNLLFETSPDEGALIREGHVLGIDLTIPRAAILIDAGNYIHTMGGADQSEQDEALMRQRTQRIISSIVNFFHLPTDTICAYIGDSEIVVLKASSTHDLVAWADQRAVEGETQPSWAGLAALKRAGAALLACISHDTGADICLGIGRYHPGVRGLKLSYQDARAALTLGRQFHGANQIYCLDSLGIAAFIGISDEPTKVDLARRLLGPLDHEPELIDTVEAFFAMDCSPSATAARLCVHRNTLGYRLEKIALLTGLDPRRFDDAVQIRLALLARSLRH
ncbi:MAG TPA: helix-turn-helix domain-containing protein [Ktedonobacterales bacterium]|nr:helix-turn-helix domain-containing protein [Ktedonobacterales bacterium]